MADLRGVIINKGKVGVSVVPPDTSTSMLLIAGMWEKADINEPDEYMDVIDVNDLGGRFWKFTSLAQAEAVGITREHDLYFGIACHRHISEFFRMAGEGTTLYVALLENSLHYILSNIDVDNYVEQFISSTKGEVRQVGLCDNDHDFNSQPISQPDIDGLSIVTIDNLLMSKLLYDKLVDAFIPASILVDFNDNRPISHITYSLREEKNIDSTGVSLILGADRTLYREFKGVGHDVSFSDVGTALGTLASASINQNIGDNENFNLTDNARDIFKDCMFNSRETIAGNIFAQNLEDLGYIFPVKYQGLNGWRWNNDHVCAPIIIDADGNMNAHTIAYNRTINEAMRSLRKVLIPKVKTRQPVDPKTGKLPVGVIKNFDNLGDSVFADMVNRGEISAGKTFTDPESDLLVEKALNVEFSVVPYGTIGEIRGTLNLKNKI